MKTNISKATIRSLDDLRISLDRFEPHWQEWANSAYSPLSQKEYQVLEHYRKHRTHNVFAENTSLTPRHVSAVYMMATRKLRQPVTFQRYKKWLCYRSLNQLGFTTPNFDLDTLIDPVSQWLMPASFASQLLQYFNNPLKEISTLPLSPNAVNIGGYNYEDIRSVRKNHLCVHLYLTVEVEE